MIYWAFIFFIISLLAGAFGLSDLAGVSMDIAQFLFIAFMVLAIIFLGIALWTGNKIKNIFS